MKIRKQLLERFKNGEDSEKVKRYIEKYWLDLEEYEAKWKDIQENIFFGFSDDYPNKVFKPDFHTLQIHGGGLFSNDEDLAMYQKIAKETGDKHFIVIMDFDYENPPYFGNEDDKILDFPLKFKFPVDINMEELVSGGYFSVMAVQMLMRNYFVFGESGAWGRYKASQDVEMDLDVIGFKKEYSDLFKSTFSKSDLFIE